MAFLYFAADGAPTRFYHHSADGSRTLFRGNYWGHEVDYKLMGRSYRIDAARYQAVLFDLDGVIADTIGLHYEAYWQAF